jgi:hypothetical protein
MGLEDHKARVVSPAVNGGPKSESPVERGCCLAASSAFEGEHLLGPVSPLRGRNAYRERLLNGGLRRSVLLPCDWAGGRMREWSRIRTKRKES